LAAEAEGGAMPQRLSNVPMADLVPETRDWNGGSGISVAGRIGCIGSVDQPVVILLECRL
jgi:hypothetical protein